MSEVQSQILRWQKGELSGDELLRALVDFQHWLVPISERAMNEALSNNAPPAISYNRNEQGEDSLYIFSDSATLDQYRKQVGDTNRHQLEVQGTWIFGIPLADFTYFNVNPFSPTSVHYKREQFQMLNDVASATLLERKLKALRYGELTGDALAQGCSEIKNYSKYFLILASADGKVEPVLAPDDKHRRLLAVFTGQDNANLLYDELARLSPATEYLLAPANGVAVAQAVLKFGYDGLVFNCRGYVEPVAFTPQFASFILNAK